MSWPKLAAVAVLLLGPAGAAAPEPVNYGEIFDKGISYPEFLDRARARRDEWRSRSKGPGLKYDVDARRIPPRRILIVTEDWCSDSVQTVPYIYLQYAEHPGVTLRIVDGTAGRPITEAHRTPDDRAATPTVVVLDGTNRFLGAWVERPAELQAWYLEQQKVLMRRELVARKTQWYEKDAGRSTLKEISALLWTAPAVKLPDSLPIR